jgi:hypothetical protein
MKTTTTAFSAERAWFSGPRDGNPIGLGLLAVFAIPAGAMVAGVGLTKLFAGHYLNRKG